MNGPVMTWMAEQVQAHDIAERSVLEVGALDVNGSVRGLFRGPYVGVDIRPGPGVDEVMDGHDLRFGDRTFDVVLSTEMLEHDSAFWLSLAEMGRVLRHGGHLFLTTRSNGFPAHDHPFDFWRFMPEAGRLLPPLAGCEWVSTGRDPEAPGILVHGRKR